MNFFVETKPFLEKKNESNCSDNYCYHLLHLSMCLRSCLPVLACVSQKTRKLYGPEKPFVKLRPAYSVKLVFSYVVKRIKVKITAKFRDTGHLNFEDTKRTMSPEKIRAFRETGPWCSSKPCLCLAASVL